MIQQNKNQQNSPSNQKVKVGQDFNLWGFSFSRTRITLVSGHYHKPEEQQKGFLLFFFSSDISETLRSHVQCPRKIMGKGKCKSGLYSRNCCQLCFKRKINNPHKGKGIGKNTLISYLILRFVFTLSEVGTMVYVCKDGKIYSVHLLLCLLLLKISSFRLKYPMLS